MRKIAVLACSIAVAVAACGAESGIPIAPPRDTPTTSTIAPPPPADAELQSLALEPVATGLSEPVALAAAPLIDEVFIVERTGRIVTASSGGTSAVLDISSKIGWEVSEQGLLGLAVHPRFPDDDPRAVVAYTDAAFDLIVASFRWNGSRFDASSETRILEVPQPHKYHQGGGVAFGPRGYLWLSFGDGGGNGDPFGNAQNPGTLNGSIVRVDVDHAEPYAIPPDNPFVGADGGSSPEVWAFGLRNPWRFTIDDGRVIIVDVGQYDAEEINVVDASGGGYNFGWPVVEGDACYEAATCDTSGFTEPALVLDRRRTCAVIGGVVYRGTAIPELHGHYVFGDHCVGWMRSAPIGDDGGFGTVTDWERRIDELGMITTFGVDPDGELLVANLEGDVSRIVPVRPSGSD